MKRFISMILILVLFTLSLTGCNTNQQGEESHNQNCEEQISNLENKISEMKSEIEGLEKEISDKKNEIVKLSSEILVLLAEKDTLGANVEYLELLISTKEAAISELNARVSALENEKIVLSSQIEKLLSENKNLTEENALLRNCLVGKHTYSDEKCLGCGIDCPYVRDGEYIYFGEYPQTIKADDVEITNVVDSRGYYLGSDGCYYAKLVSKVRTTVYKFSNGNNIEKAAVYYFKVEPIRWRILEEKDGEALIFCDVILNNMEYQSTYVAEGDNYTTTANGAVEEVYANNYRYSDVRAWLNGQFIDYAFNSNQNSIILTTTVDNSVESTGYASNIYVCEDTQDKAFILSYAEVINPDYGFAAEEVKDEARLIKSSDYAIANGMLINTYTEQYGCGYWWLRSPIDTYSMIVRNISGGGTAGGNISIYANYNGVVPAMRITL